MTTPAPRRSPSGSRRAALLTRIPPGLLAAARRHWMEIWIAAVVVAFLLPTIRLAEAQRAWRRLEREAWETTLDPDLPDPGLPPIESFDTSHPKRVSIGFYMESIEHVSVRDGGWDTILDVWCTWDDDPADPDFDPFDRLLPVNGTIEESTLLRERHADGRHYVHRRLDLRFNRGFRVVNYPFDRHLLLASFEYSARERPALLFVPDDENSAVSSRASASGFRIGRYHAVENPHSYITDRGWPDDPGHRGTWSQPRFAIEIERRGLGLFLLLFQALFVSVGVALLPCFIKPTHVDPRFGLGVGALFAVVANSYLVGAQMPESGEFSLADFVSLLGIGTIFITLAQSTISLWLYETCDDPPASRRFDRISFWLILACFCVSLVLLLAGAMERA